MSAANANQHTSTQEPKHPHRHRPDRPTSKGCDPQDGDGQDGIGGGMADIRGGGQTGSTGTSG